ncbi:MAG: divergent PAP2 family protein [Treponema sp.]|nr:divergent PAP2 family protein [Treponema sp.]
MENFTNQIQLLLTNPVLIACILSWFTAQLIKTLIKLCGGKVHSVAELFELVLWRTGSMPSSHASLVTCLCTMIAFRCGVDSDIFILSLCFFLVTIRDAMGVRRSSGIQSKLLNRISSVLSENGLMDSQTVKETDGHSPLEVFVGCLIGFFIGIAFCLL